MPTWDGCTDARGSHIRNIRAIFRFHFLYLLESLPAAKHVELSCDAEHERLTRGIFGVVRNVNMSVDQSGQQSPTLAFDYLSTLRFERGPSNLANSSVLYEHAAMFEHVLAIKKSNITYELGRGWCLTQRGSYRKTYP
jgi:hypothetical protein